jgi:hypothetical protein
MPRKLKGALDNAKRHAKSTFTKKNTAKRVKPNVGKARGF